MSLRKMFSWKNKGMHKEKWFLKEKITFNISTHEEKKVRIKKKYMFREKLHT